jgi:hypothetical protein
MAEQPLSDGGTQRQLQKPKRIDLAVVVCECHCKKTWKASSE